MLNLQKLKNPFIKGTVKEIVKPIRAYLDVDDTKIIMKFKILQFLLNKDTCFSQFDVDGNKYGFEGSLKT